ncbi:hypothetical protein S7711_06664 [Stachybotrys chartarum IBT 7711]|uniref:Zn(2)-C6 fungal-type domain-containing protein n=1 Tax=Stachybotrys chartarum (strain CBS 109288 / IBT 7711) TaxID=1280523 RepID=A0A084BB33_STACB|nr:hypothetical protein S7711_06664 [Stachybotrys chartarum IBT 7711]KFA45853.1 hypothetical protein S40293_09466 [Stachybotrys chartarum IBT 40293]
MLDSKQLAGAHVRLSTHARASTQPIRSSSRRYRRRESMSGVNVAAPTPPANNDETQRQSVQRLLPTCQRCRRLRRKCDTQLPSCRACEKAGAECTFYDHALKQALPRS